MALLHLTLAEFTQVFPVQVGTGLLVYSLNPSGQVLRATQFTSLGGVYEYVFDVEEVDENTLLAFLKSFPALIARKVSEIE